MTGKKLTEQAKRAALTHGADLVGAVKLEDLPEHSERIKRIVPGARSVLVIAARHSLGSLRVFVFGLGTMSSRTWSPAGPWQNSQEISRWPP